MQAGPQPLHEDVPRTANALRLQPASVGGAEKRRLGQSLDRRHVGAPCPLAAERKRETPALASRRWVTCSFPDSLVNRSLEWFIRALLTSHIRTEVIACD